MQSAPNKDRLLRAVRSRLVQALRRHPSSRRGYVFSPPPPLSSQACPSFSPLMRPTQQQDGMAEKNKLLVKQLKQERATIRTLQAQLDEAERTLDAALAEQNRQLHAS